MLQFYFETFDFNEATLFEEGFLTFLCKVESGSSEIAFQRYFFPLQPKLAAGWVWRKEARSFL